MISELPNKIDPLLVSSAVLSRSRELLEPYSLRQVEVCLLWYGYVVDDSTCIVTTCVRPEQESRAKNYEISAAAMREVRKQVRPHRLLLIVQVHTHPAEAYFSSWDQQHALNNRTGALNMVIPDYGRARWIDPSGFCMVERTGDGGWRSWSRDDWRRLVTVPDILGAPTSL